MGADTSIAWTDRTFNGWIGCTKVSTAASGGGACDFCYAEADFDLRKHVAKWGAGQPRHRTKTWAEPLKWNRQAEAFRVEHGHWPRVFAMSLADVFDNEVPDEWHKEFNDLVAATPNLRWQLTTKRAVNIPKMVPPGFFRANQHAGVIVSICNQAEADRDGPRIFRLKKELGISWVGISFEPLFGPVNLAQAGLEVLMRDLDGPDEVNLDWAIVGGESGPYARPFNTDWAKSIVDQCSGAGVPCFVKQVGAHVIQGGERRIKRDKKGGDMSEWPHEIRVRQFPQGAT